VDDFSPDDVRRMQELAAEVWSTWPESVNGEATVGELAWVYGKDNAVLGHTWARRFFGDEGWGWIRRPYRVLRSDGGFNEVRTATLAWQTHPSRPDLLDDILDWYDAEAAGVDRTVVCESGNADALDRLAAHGYELSDDEFWTQLNAQELDGVREPVAPEGFRFRTADEVGPAAAVRAHVDAWHPSSFTEVSYEGVRRMWPYRPDLHVLLEAPDGTLVSSAIIWLDERNHTAEFEPVGTHQGYRRQGRGSVLLRHGMARAKAAGATTMLVACLGHEAHPAARTLYHGVGFREFSRDVPHVRRDSGCGSPARE
jgi:GNAT superfamily N-acetyltransferase